LGRLFKGNGFYVAVAHTDEIMGKLDFLLHPFILSFVNLNDLGFG
jgi:hypothetical protein